MASTLVRSPKSHSLGNGPAMRKLPADRRWLCVVLLSAFCLVYFFHGLQVGDLWRTENLRAIIAAEILKSGNWIVPRLYGQPLFTKPPGMYIAIALCSWPFGEVTNWSARMPSALAATALVFLTYWYFGRQLGRLGGLVAALVLPLSTFFLEKAAAAEIDMLQVFWTSGAILFFLRAVEDEDNSDGNSATMPGDRPKSAPVKWWLLAYLFFAGGVLTKWTTPAFFYTMAIPLLWWRGRLRLLFCWRHAAGLALAGSICLSWAAAAVALEGWAVFSSTIQSEALPRLSPNHSPEPYPWMESLVHPVTLILVTMPLSLVALLALRPDFYRCWDEKGKRLLLALHCWTWPNMIFWSLPIDHSPRNSAPLFPGIAGLAAMVILAWITGRLPWRWPRMRPNHLLIGVVMLAIICKLAYVHLVMVERTRIRQTQTKGNLLAALIPLDRVLYIFRFKDEGVMFYYGRKVLRLASPLQLPDAKHPLYCVVAPAELENWPSSQRVQFVQRLTDAQGDPMVLIRVINQ